MSVKDLIIRYSVVIESRGERVIDDGTAKILRTLRETGSILATSRILGIPYSRVWETMNKIERAAGRRVVEGRRGGKGGGGVRLTRFGEELLTLYDIAKSRLESLGLIGPSHSTPSKPDLTVAHSHDPVLASIISMLSRNGVNVNSFCVGSGLSLAMLSLGSADVACIHLYDPHTGLYNKPFMERFWLGDNTVLIGSYARELVLAYRRELEFEDLDDALLRILNGEVRVAFRNRGSGTKEYLEHILKKKADEFKRDLSMVQGIGTELQTHEEVANSIATGKADVGLTLRYTAENHDLEWIHVTWEPYECYALKDRVSSPGIAKMRDVMNSESLKNLLSTLPGYKTSIS
ncbi:MAG: substrate-binding domain-containing protein [Zestosphaera sp.]